jgi:hypothetical protein
MDRLSEQVRAAVIAAPARKLPVRNRAELVKAITVGLRQLPRTTPRHATISRVPWPGGCAMATSRCERACVLDILP